MDIVKRLLDWEECDDGKINYARCEAAHEIERLRKALQKIVDPESIRLLPSDENPSPAAHKLIVRYRSIARKALKGKE
jgi:hypothetical protein